jgi:AmmeMemoRadiSam system protein B
MNVYGEFQRNQNKIERATLTTNVQTPTVAGYFYPADPGELRSDVRQFISAATQELTHPPKALIAPHAGYIYSGPIAGTAYAQLSKVADSITSVVILAPSHRVTFRGIALSSAEFFRTPLGDIEVDKDVISLIEDMPQVNILDSAFTQEHSLEVHLPFLQETLNNFKIVPLVIGDIDQEYVANVIEKVWGGDETLIVVSSDLSHYLDYETAKAMDTATSNAIENLQPNKISHKQACGRTPVNGLIIVAQRNNLEVITLDLRNSGDTAGPRDQVVGYGAYAFS